MFVDANDGPLTTDHRLAEVLRAALLEAGATRSELHQDGVNRRKLRVHDLRAPLRHAFAGERQDPAKVMGAIRSPRDDTEIGVPGRN